MATRKSVGKPRPLLKQKEKAPARKAVAKRSEKPQTPTSFPSTPTAGPRSRPVGFASASRPLQTGLSMPADVLVVASHPEQRRQRVKEVLNMATRPETPPLPSRGHEHGVQGTTGKDGETTRRNDRRLEALRKETRTATPHFVKSDYFGTAEHRALADTLKRLLAGEPVLGPPQGDPSHVLLLRKDAGGKVDLGRVLPVAEVDVGGAGNDWLQGFRKRFADTLAWYDPLQELTIRDGLMLRYADILALAGDYFETPQELADELTPEVIKAIQGVTPEAPGTFMLTTHRGWGNYLGLANKNQDHFSPRNWFRYAVHHAEALKLALSRRYEQALVQNAFADHFLSDAFASGHLRVPRDALSGLKGAWPSREMHNEENQNGLWVQDLGGRIWRAYGDDELGRNPVHVTLTALAVGISLERVHRAYRLEGEGAISLGSVISTWLEQGDDQVEAGTFVDPGTLPDWLGLTSGLPDIRSCLPVALPWQAQRPPGQHLCNYPPMCWKDADGKLKKRKGTPHFQEFFGVVGPVRSGLDRVTPATTAAQPGTK